MLLSTFEQLWLPVLNDLPDIEYIGQECHRAPYGTIEPMPNPTFHGALWLTPKVGVELPPSLTNPKDWHPASAALDLNGRLVRIQVQAMETEITFTSINLNLKPHELLRELNRELVRANAGVYVWKVEPVNETSNAVRHLFPDGDIPTLSNAHTRADVTGYAILEDRPYQHTLLYVGVAAHKTSVESLWASLVRGRGACSLRGASLITDGEVRMLAQALPDFGVMHAGIICRKALPGQWEAKDDSVYALVFEQGMDLEIELQKVALKRLQEALAFPIPEEWAKTIWEHGLDAGYIQRLETGGDCLGGVKIDLTKPWQELVQNLLEQEVLMIHEAPHVSNNPT